MSFLSTCDLMDRAKQNIVLLKSQEQALKEIAATISLYLMRLQAIDQGFNEGMLPRVAQLVIAPTGCGKTFLLKALATAAELDFISLDASTLTPSGYKGENLQQSLATQLKHVRSYGGKKRCIVLIDEFDKAAIGRNGRDSFFNMQSDFLTILEGGKVCYDEQKENAYYDTSEILFLFSGAFEGIEKITNDSVPAVKTIGFLSRYEEQETLSGKSEGITLNHVDKYGFSKELVGRIGSIVTIPKLNENDFVTLIKDKTAGTQKQYETLLSASGLGFEITESAIKVISREANRLNIGARAINPVIRQSILSCLNEIGRAPEISGIILDEENGELITRYDYSGKRTQSKEMKPRNDEGSNQSIAAELCSEEGIEKLCTEMLSATIDEPSNGRYEMISLFFMQAVLRFLLIETNPEDQCSASIVKLANCTEWNGGDPTTFDIIMTDYLEKSTEVNLNKIVLKYCYARYKELENYETSSYIKRRIEKCVRTWEREKSLHNANFERKDTE